MGVYVELLCKCCGRRIKNPKLDVEYGNVTRRDYLQQAITIFVTHGKSYQFSLGENLLRPDAKHQKLENPQDLV